MRAFLVFCCILGASTVAGADSFSGGNLGLGLHGAVLVLGQSNAFGVSGSEAIPGPRVDLPMLPGYIIPRLWERGASTWKNLTDEEIWTVNYPWMATPWPWFAQEWQERTGEPAMVILVATGGTGLCSSCGTHWDPAIGDYYPQAITAVAASGVGASLRAVLWNGGETESSVLCVTTPSGVKYDDNKAALKNLADAIWAQFGVPMAVAAMSLKTGTPCTAGITQGYLDIREAIIDAAAESDHILDTVLYTDDLDHKADNCSHVYEVNVAGERWVDLLETEGLMH